MTILTPCVKTDVRAILARFLNRVVGVPFKDKGRGFDGLDCWGVVWLAHKAVGNELPLYGEATFRDVESAASLVIGQTDAPPWIPVNRGEERALDMAVLRTPVKAGGKWVRLDCHVGLVTGQGWLAHCEEHVGVVHVPFGHHMVARRISRIYRHEAFA